MRHLIRQHTLAALCRNAGYATAFALLAAVGRLLDFFAHISAPGAYATVTARRLAALVERAA
jgi:hypothetical protein